MFGATLLPRERRGLWNRTPSPVPLSSMKSKPLASSAALTVSPRPLISHRQHWRGGVVSLRVGGTTVDEFAAGFSQNLKH